MNKIRSIVRTSLILTLAISIGGCGLFNKDPQSVTSSVDASDPGTAGLKNVDQLAPSMSSVTGIALSAMDSSVGVSMSLADQSAEIGPWLSSDGSVTGLNSSMLLSITGLAGSFCAIFVKKEAAASASSRLVHGLVNFNAGPSGLTTSVVSDVAAKLAKQFWQRDITADELQIMQQSVTDAIAGIGTVTGSASVQSAAAQKVLMVPCTAALSALDFIKA